MFVRGQEGQGVERECEREGRTGDGGSVKEKEGQGIEEV